MSCCTHRSGGEDITTTTAADLVDAAAGDSLEGFRERSKARRLLRINERRISVVELHQSESQRVFRRSWTSKEVS